MTTRRMSRKRAYEVLALKGLFILLARLRAANAESLYALYFQRAGYSLRTATRRLAQLVEEGFLAHRSLVGGRSIYFVTGKTIDAFSSVAARATDAYRKPPSDHIGAYCWLRAMVHAELVREGFEVGRNPEALWALRRFYIDDLTAWMAQHPEHRDDYGELKCVREDADLKPRGNMACRRCHRRVAGAAEQKCSTCAGSLEFRPWKMMFRCATCAAVFDEIKNHHVDGQGKPCEGRIREVDVLSCDLAWRVVGGRYDIRLVLVDEPNVAIERQLDRLPFGHTWNVKVPVIWKTTDPTSIYDARAGRWVRMGRRHRYLKNAFVEGGNERGENWSHWTTVVDFRPWLQMRVLHPLRGAAALEEEPEGGEAFGGRRGGPKLKFARDGAHEHQREHAPVERAERVAPAREDANAEGRARESDKRAVHALPARDANEPKREPVPNAEREAQAQRDENARAAERAERLDRFVVARGGGRGR